MARCKKIVESLLNEMAFSSEKWVDHVRDFILGGALGEYTCLVIADNIREEDNWSNEVITILKRLDAYMNEKVIKGKSKFDRKKALEEAIVEASTFQHQITSAKSKMITYYPESRKKILRLKLDSEELLIKMLKRFKPEYLREDI